MVSGVLVKSSCYISRTFWNELAKSKCSYDCSSSNHGNTSRPGKQLSPRVLEAHYLAGGDVPRVIRALIAAHRAVIDLDYDKACGIDLAGRDVLDAVQTSVNPKVIDCPDVASGKSTLSAVARNGVELRIRARVTVRTNLHQLIGGATEETIIARVGEGIITSIGSAATHFEVMDTRIQFQRLYSNEVSMHKPLFKLYLSTSLISRLVKTLEPGFRLIKQRPTHAWHVPKQRNDGRWPSLMNKK